MCITLSGYIERGDSERQRLPITSEINENALAEVLSLLKGANGIIGLRHQPEPETGPYELTMYSDDGNFLLMLNEYADDGDVNVGTITDPGAGSGLIPILGDYYSAKSVTRDFKLVFSIFKEFAETGNVSEQFMR